MTHFGWVVICRKLAALVFGFVLLHATLCESSQEVRTHPGQQDTQPTITPEIAQLAARIAEPISKAHAKNILVIDLRGPELQSHPLGSWLANQLAAALRRDFPMLQIADRSQATTTEYSNEARESLQTAINGGKKQARSLGARTVILGSFAGLPRGIGITLTAWESSETGRRFGEANGLVPLSDEMTAASRGPIPSFQGRIARAGVGGITTPTCIRCPQPDYTSRARAAKYQGTVLLDVVVNAEGRTEKIVVVKGPGLGLEENAIKAISGWRLQPSRDPDGIPVSARTEVEVTFKLF